MSDSIHQNDSSLNEILQTLINPQKQVSEQKVDFAIPAKKANERTFKPFGNTIPGPAGAYFITPENKQEPSQMENSDLSIWEEESSDGYITLDNNDNSFFKSGSWLKALKQQNLIPYGDKDLPFSIAKINEDKNIERVPDLLVIITSCIAYENEAKVTLRDPTGLITGFIHRKVIEEYNEIRTGTAVVFSPFNRGKYLNIVLSNIIKVFVDEDSLIEDFSSQNQTQNNQKDDNLWKEFLQLSSTKKKNLYRNSIKQVETPITPMKFKSQDLNSQPNEVNRLSNTQLPQTKLNNQQPSDSSKDQLNKEFMELLLDEDFDLDLF